VAEQDVRQAQAQPEVDEAALVEARLKAIALELEQVGAEYKNISYLEGVSGRMRLLDKMNALTEEAKRLREAGWPSPKKVEPEAKLPPYLDDARWLLGGQGGVGAVPGHQEQAFDYGRARYGG